MTEATESPIIDLSRSVEASPETVWSILTTPALFSSWMDGIVTFEPAAGSSFRAEFPQFATVVAGEIISVDPAARRLELTWGVEKGPQAEGFPAGSSRVSFEVTAEGDGCRVQVVHGRLPTTDEAAQHASGWGFHLGRMALFANRRDLEAGLERTLAGWFSAWNEQDDERRLELLESCCAEDVEFRDEWADARGVDRLSQHIMMCFRFMPGWSIEATGDVRICRGEALVGWRSTGPGGAVQGFNLVRASPDGLIKRVAGFPESQARDGS